MTAQQAEFGEIAGSGGRSFRHPLRNDWDRLKPHFETAAAQATGQEAVTARAMLDIMPAFLTIVERERDRRTPADQTFNAFFALIGMLAENAIETAYRTPRGRREALTELLRRLDRVVGARLAKPSGAGGLILPGA
jgi:hypothetical protein